MARRKKGESTPTLRLRITEDQWQTAIRSKSGGCLISDAIKRQYPHFQRPETDMATIRFTDPEQGVRYVYLTPPSAQHLLLAFDQGWNSTTSEVVIKTAVQIVPITRAATGATSIPAQREKREKRRAELQQKLDMGEELTKGEKISLTRSSSTWEPPQRPAATGPKRIEEVAPGATSSARSAPPTVVGGKAPKKLPGNPNLLTGRNRHYGARLADPGMAFREAVAQRVAEEMERQELGVRPA